MPLPWCLIGLMAVVLLLVVVWLLLAGGAKLSEEARDAESD